MRAYGFNTRRGRDNTYLAGGLVGGLSSAVDAFSNAFHRAQDKKEMRTEKLADEARMDQKRLAEEERAKLYGNEQAKIGLLPKLDQYRIRAGLNDTGQGFGGGGMGDQGPASEFTPLDAGYKAIQAREKAAADAAAAAVQFERDKFAEEGRHNKAMEGIGWTAPTREAKARKLYIDDPSRASLIGRDINAELQKGQPAEPQGFWPGLLSKGLNWAVPGLGDQMIPAPQPTPGLDPLTAIATTQKVTGAYPAPKLQPRGPMVINNNGKSDAEIRKLVLGEQLDQAQDTMTPEASAMNIIMNAAPNDEDAKEDAFMMLYGGPQNDTPENRAKFEGWLRTVPRLTTR